MSADVLRDLTRAKVVFQLRALRLVLGDRDRGSNEIWMPIPGYEGRYEASSLGRIRSLRSGGLVLKTPPDRDGYPHVSLRREGKLRVVHVHRLVAETFHGPSRPVHREVAHLDGNRANARADNLKWCSKVENHSHKRLHGTHQAGEKHPRAKLTNSDVIAIRASGERYADLAKRFGVSRHTISDIRRGRRWGSVHESPGAAGNRPDTGSIEWTKEGV